MSGYEGLSLTQAQTTVVNVVVLVQAFHLLNCRVAEPVIFPAALVRQPGHPGGIVATVLAQLATTCLPLFHRLFHTAAIPAVEWARVMALDLATFGIIGFVKAVELAVMKKG